MPDFSQLPWLKVGIYCVLAGGAWYMLNKTFKKLISNQHRIIHMLEQQSYRPAQTCLLGGQGDRLSELLERRTAAEPRMAPSLPVPLALDVIEPPPRLEGAQVLLFGTARLDEVARLLAWSGRPKALVGVDTSIERLENARHRLGFELKLPLELAALLPDDPTVPLAPNSVDYVHCMDDAHLGYPLQQVLKALRKVVKPGGHVRIAVPNEESVYHHLCEPSLLRSSSADARPRAARGVYRRGEFRDIAAECGFGARPAGCMLSPLELSLLHRRSTVLADRSLAKEHLDFLEQLQVDELGRPLYRGEIAGHLLVFELTPV